MSDFSLTLVLHFKTSKNFNGMAKVQIKYEKITPFRGIFHVREQLSRFVDPVIDKEGQGTGQCPVSPNIVFDTFEIGGFRM